MHLESLLDMHTHEMHFAPPWKRDPWKGSYFRGHDEGADDLCLFREKTMPEIAFEHSDFSCNVNKVN